MSQNAKSNSALIVCSLYVCFFPLIYMGPDCLNKNIISNFFVLFNFLTNIPRDFWSNQRCSVNAGSVHLDLAGTGRDLRAKPSPVCEHFDRL